jgi:hypothetical protein
MSHNTADANQRFREAWDETNARWLAGESEEERVAREAWFAALST